MAGLSTKGNGNGVLPETQRAAAIRLLQEERGVDPIAAARRKAQARAANDEKAQGPEWPRAEDITLEIALTDLCVAQFESGLSLGSGAMRDGMAVWVRLKYPVGIDDRRAGRVAFTVSDTLEKALRKAAQLLCEDSMRIWQEDKYASRG